MVPQLRASFLPYSRILDLTKKLYSDKHTSLFHRSVSDKEKVTLIPVRLLPRETRSRCCRSVKNFLKLFSAVMHGSLTFDRKTFSQHRYDLLKDRIEELIQVHFYCIGQMSVGQKVLNEMTRSPPPCKAHFHFSKIGVKLVNFRDQKIKILCF
jgi:hypothetical protein